MQFDNIPAGINPPEDIYVAIEIPANSSPVKYELDNTPWPMTATHWTFWW